MEYDNNDSGFVISCASSSWPWNWSSQIWCAQRNVRIFHSPKRWISRTKLTICRWKTKNTSDGMSWKKISSVLTPGIEDQQWQSKVEETSNRTFRSEEKDIDGRVPETWNKMMSSLKTCFSDLYFADVKTCQIRRRLMDDIIFREDFFSLSFQCPNRMREK